MTPADLLRGPAGEQFARLPAMKNPRPESADLRVVVGGNVLRWREHQGLSPGDLARKIGGSWTSVTVGCVEQGSHGANSRGITVDTLEHFSKALELTPADLVRVAGQRPMSRGAE